MCQNLLYARKQRDMPRISLKEQLDRQLEALEEIAAFIDDADSSSAFESDDTIETLASDASNDIQEYENFMREPLQPLVRLLRQDINDRRYVEPRRAVPKSRDWFKTILPTLSDERFKVFTRMSRQSFAFVLEQIADHQVFKNQSNNQQVAVEDQLLIALSDGNRAGFIPLASTFGCSEGHVFDCVTRVVEALADSKDQFIRWPTAADRRKEAEKNRVRAGFLDVVGKVDGTDIVLEHKPGTLLTRYM